LVGRLARIAGAEVDQLDALRRGLSLCLLQPEEGVRALCREDGGDVHRGKR
jgi:hypothetical protein